MRVTTSRIEEPEAALERNRAPHLSYSEVNRYLTCPEQYRLWYLERLRPRLESASLVFGALIHVSLADLFRDGLDPVETFEREWQNVKAIELRYHERDSWESLGEKGRKLLTKFQWEAVRIEKVFQVEAKFELAVSSLEEPFIGIVDLICEVEGKRSIIDWKTSVSSYEEHEVILSDQLTAYWLADPEAERVGFCVLVKTKEPKIEWHWAERDAERLAEFLAKVRIVADDIAAGKFYKRPGRWCSYCDFLPVCVGDKKKAEETLVKIT